MSKYTPGPWTFAWHNNHDAQITFACVVMGNEVKVIGNGEQHIANARLIAAAPDLLEVLKDILNDGMHCDVVPHLHRKALAAIAIATGETT